MAILRMKKLRLFALRADHDELLTELQKLGCVEVRESSADVPEAEASGIPRDGGAELRASYADLLRAVRVLDSHAPRRTPFLKPKETVGADRFLDASFMDSAAETAKGLLDAQAKIRENLSASARIRSEAEGLQPWKDYSVPLETCGTERTKLVLGTVPAKTDWEDLTAAVGGAAAEAQLFPVRRDDRQICLAALFLREKETGVMSVLREREFTQFSPGGQKGTVREVLARQDEELRRLDDENGKLAVWIRSRATERENLYHAADLLSSRVARQDASDKLAETDSVFILEGYTPAASAGALERALERFDCVCAFEDPDPADAPDVPTALKNNRLTDPLNMVTDMYSLPAYDGVDPNPLMMPFFVLFYGIMLADMGYGLLMIIAGLVLLKKKRPKGTMRHFSGLLVECGISTFLVGALTGSCFGDAPLQIARLLRPDTAFCGIPALFTPLDDTVAILIGSMALGIVHLFTGMVINFVRTTKNGHFADALMDQGSWWLFLAGIGLGAAGVTWWGAAAGLAALIGTQGRNRPGFFGKLAGGVASLYDVTGYLGDILSYSRLMALMLAGSVIAQVFNTLGALPGNIFFFIPVFLIGHAINFGLNLLGCYVHDLRLQCLEYFNKFYKDGGRPFRPLELESKYYEVIR